MFILEVVLILLQQLPLQDPQDPLVFKDRQDLLALLVLKALVLLFSVLMQLLNFLKQTIQ
jgi:hypothetical protein